MLFFQKSLPQWAVMNKAESIRQKKDAGIRQTLIAYALSNPCIFLVQGRTAAFLLMAHRECCSGTE